MRPTLAAQPEFLSRLRTLMDAQRGVSFKRRHLNLVAQRNLREGDEDDAMKVIAIALEELVRFDRQHDIKVTLTTTGTPRVAFTLVTNTGSIFHSSRYGDTDGVAPVGQSCTVALETGVGDHLPATVTNWAGAGDGEESLLVTYLPTAGALFAGFRAAPGRCAGSAAIGAELRPAELDFYLLAENRLFELELQIVANVAATLAASIATPSTHVEHLTEEVAKDITHIGVGEPLEA